MLPLLRLFPLFIYSLSAYSTFPISFEPIEGYSLLGSAFSGLVGISGSGMLCLMSSPLRMRIISMRLVMECSLDCSLSATWSMSE